MRRLVVGAALIATLGLVSDCFGQGPGGRGAGCGAGRSSMGRRAGGMQSALLRRSLYGSATANNSGSNSQPADPEKTRQAVLRIYDVDYDGTLSETERARLIDAMKVRGYSNAYIARFFANVLGISLAPETNSAAVTNSAAAKKNKGATKLQGEMLGKFDANSDGKLSTAEKIAMRQSLLAERSVAKE